MHRSFAIGLIAALAAVLLSACTGASSPSTAGVGSSPSGSCSGECASASTTDGPFRLTLAMQRLDWKAEDAITGVASLSLDGAPATTIYGSSQLISFAFDEAGGDRHVQPVWPADCRSWPLDAAAPITADLAKSGGATGLEPDADFLRSFFADPKVRLPAGTWDVTALSEVWDGPACSGHLRQMRAVVRITVSR